MDILALAQLPLATLVLVATIWLLFQLFTYTHSYVASRHRRSVARQEIRFHAMHLHFNMRSALQGITSALAEVHDAVEELASAKQTEKKFLQSLDETVRKLWKSGSSGAFSFASPLAPERDFMQSEPFFDLPATVEKLDELDSKSAGFVLLLAEEKRFLDELVKNFNKSNDTADSLALCVRLLVSLQWSALRLILATHILNERPLCHLRFWSQKQDCLGGTLLKQLEKSGHRDPTSDVLQAMASLFPEDAVPEFWEYIDKSQENSDPDDATDAFVLKRFNLTQTQVRDLTKRDIWAESFKTALARRELPWHALMYIAPLAVAGGLIYMVLKPGDAKEFLFPSPSPEITCSAVIRDGEVVQLSCPIDVILNQN